VLEKTSAGDFESMIERANFIDELLSVLPAAAIQSDEDGNLALGDQVLELWRQRVEADRANGLRVVQAAHVAEIQTAFHSLRLS
jgi:hypothetical protein